MHVTVNGLYKRIDYYNQIKQYYIEFEMKFLGVYSLK